MTSTTYKIPNISCNHCVMTIEFELGEIPGIEIVKANAETKTAEVVYKDPATEDLIINLLAKIDYPAVI